MLKWPEFDLPFVPQLSYWLGGIEVYDREEALGVLLSAYDPNNFSDREIVIKEFILINFPSFTYKHKFLMVKVLEDALNSPEHDFTRQFEDDYDSNTCVAWNETMVNDARGFFEDIYRLASECWSEDLEKARVEDPSTW